MCNVRYPWSFPCFFYDVYIFLVCFCGCANMSKYETSTLQKEEVSLLSPPLVLYFTFLDFKHTQVEFAPRAHVPLFRWIGYSMAYYSVAKKTEIMQFVGKLIELGNILLCKVTQTQEEKCCMSSFIGGFSFRSSDVIHVLV